MALSALTNIFFSTYSLLGRYCYLKILISKPLLNSPRGILKTATLGENAMFSSGELSLGRWNYTIFIWEL